MGPGSETGHSSCLQRRHFLCRTLPGWAPGSPCPGCQHDDGLQMTTGDPSSAPGQTLAPPPKHTHAHPPISPADSFSLPGGRHKAAAHPQGHRGKQDLPPAPRPPRLGAFLPSGTTEHSLWTGQTQALCCSESRAQSHPQGATGQMLNSQTWTAVRP